MRTGATDAARKQGCPVTKQARSKGSATPTGEAHAAAVCCEEDLLARARRGDRQALGAVLRGHRPKMRSVALRICRSPSDADDVVQEACLCVMRKLDQYRGDAPFSTWLHRITVNTGLLLLRTRSRQRLSSFAPADGTGERRPDQDPDRGAKAPVDDSPLPDQQSHDRRCLQQVALLATRLPRAMLLTLELREVHGLDGTEVAAHLGVSLEVVKTRIHRARTTLRTLIGEDPLWADRRAA